MSIGPQARNGAITMLAQRRMAPADRRALPLIRGFAQALPRVECKLSLRDKLF
jgi:hypothetical protein